MTLRKSAVPLTTRKVALRINGVPTPSLAVNKRSGENLIQTVDRVKAVVNEQLAALDPQIADQVDVTYSYDESTSVRQLLGDLISNTAFAILLVMIVVLGILGLRAAPFGGGRHSRVIHDRVLGS